MFDFLRRNSISRSGISLADTPKEDPENICNKCGHEASEFCEKTDIFACGNKYCGVHFVQAQYSGIQELAYGKFYEGAEYLVHFPGRRKPITLLCTKKSRVSLTMCVNGLYNISNITIYIEGGSEMIYFDKVSVYPFARRKE
jgi:hypothetical protein